MEVTLSAQTRAWEQAPHPTEANESSSPPAKPVSATKKKTSEVLQEQLEVLRGRYSERPGSSWKATSMRWKLPCRRRRARGNRPRTRRRRMNPPPRLPSRSPQQRRRHRKSCKSNSKCFAAAIARGQGHPGRQPQCDGSYPVGADARVGTGPAPDGGE